MLKNLKSLATILVLVITLQAKSHANDYWAVEVDPIAYALEGYSFHGIYGIHSLRWDLGVFGLKVPNSGVHFDSELSHAQQTNQSVYMNGLGVKMDYIFENNIFVGIQENSIILSHQTEDIWRHDLALRIGYISTIAFISESLYWQPWIAWGPTLYQEKFKNTNTALKNIPFATIHLGWKF